MGHVPATVIVGAQWGDEGKGKIVDLLAQESDLVCRYQGGPNAGHTIVVDGETYKIRAIPSGIVAGVASAIGAGCVVDPEVLIGELDELESRGHRTDGLVFVSGNAHLIMPWHVALDGARERRLGKLQIGTTRRGIGPAYADKATRIGIRVQDLLDPKILREKVELAAGEKNVWLERVYGIDPFDAEEVVARTLAHAERLAPYVADTSLLVDRALRDGRRVLFEGAQGTLLDLDHGTYPFVTSSSPIAAGAAVSFGIGPQRIDEVVGRLEGVRDPRRRGPVPERDRRARAGARARARRRVRHRDRPRAPLRLARPRGAALRRPRQRHHVARADEARRALRRSTRSRSASATACPTGRETEDFPAHQSDFHHCAPVFETLPGLERGARPGRRCPPRRADYVVVRRGRARRSVTLVGTGAVARRRARAPARRLGPVRVLVVGSGGREHALAWRLAVVARADRAPCRARATPGSRRSRPAIRSLPTTPRACSAWRGSLGIDLVVVGPEAPLVAGVADVLRHAGHPGLRAVGRGGADRGVEGVREGRDGRGRRPDRRACSTRRARRACSRPTGWRPEGRRRLPDGRRARGRPRGRSRTFGGDVARRGAARGARGVGPRRSATGRTRVALAPSRDFKRAYDGDEGPNTGGMGSFAPVPDVGDDALDELVETCIRPVLARARPTRHALRRDALRRADAHGGRPARARVQLPVRRPGDAVGASARRRRPADGARRGRERVARRRRARARSRAPR